MSGHVESGEHRVLAAITIGQAPRVDLIPDVAPLLPQGVEVREYGALDDLTFEQVEAAFNPTENDEVLVSRMRDGRQARFTEAFVTPLVQKKILQAEAEGADVVALFCTGSFGQFEHERLLVEPHALLHATVRALAADRLVAVLVPMPDQVEQAYRYWGESGVNVTVACASPYLDRSRVSEAAEGFRGSDAALVVCDCMGYSQDMRADVRRACGLPVLLPRTLVGRVLAELLS